jgi:site-specific DNA-cytosine methylase
MHVAAVMQPWCCWLENVQNLVTIHEGRAWKAVQSMAEGAGYEMKVDMV